MRGVCLRMKVEVLKIYILNIYLRNNSKLFRKNLKSLQVSQCKSNGIYDMIFLIRFETL